MSIEDSPGMRAMQLLYARGEHASLAAKASRLRDEYNAEAAEYNWRISYNAADLASAQGFRARAQQVREQTRELVALRAGIDAGMKEAFQWVKGLSKPVSALDRLQRDLLIILLGAATYRQRVADMDLGRLGATEDAKAVALEAVGWKEQCASTTSSFEDHARLRMRALKPAAPVDGLLGLSPGDYLSLKNC